MKKILAIAAALALSLSAMADEGMWMLPLLQKMNIKAMKDLGCQLSASDIYKINGSSLKDAVVHFGGGCTGELISKEGLLVTNHHCGYGSIQMLSTPKANYLEDGFWAMTREQEIPVPGLTVTFLESMTDATPAMTKAYGKAIKDYKNSDNIGELAEKARQEAAKQLRDKIAQDNPGCEVDIVNFYNQNVAYIIVTKVYKDVRFVGAPPASLGKFGGETDNWMWPRHTCDFSMFRVYADKKNNPAEYSPLNVPYKAKTALKINLSGVSNRDFTMVMGYPGRTQRFQTADQLEAMMEQYGIAVKARTVRQAVMKEGMESDPAIRLQYASKYASSSNGWKKWQGEQLAFKKLGIIPRERQKEAEFTAWVGQDARRQAKYGKALSQISEGVKGQRQAYADLYTLVESVSRIAPVGFVSTFGQAYSEAASGADSLKASEKAVEAVLAQMKDYNEPLEKKIAVAMLQFYRDNARPEVYLEGLGEDFATMDFKAYVDKLFAESAFTSPEKVKTLLGKRPGDCSDDPAMKLAEAMAARWSELSAPIRASRPLIAEGSKAFTAGLMEWKKDEPSYPDANSTMRLTYGQVMSYSPKDGVIYKHYTTLKGVMEKEDPSNYEFRVPALLKGLYDNKIFGQYADADGNIPTCFITNNDITGGNSGSPVLNAKGELVGLAFDGNWESMSSDVMFEPDLQRCICVDIRYVLFIVDKFGGAGHLLNEMTIVKK